MGAVVIDHVSGCSADARGKGKREWRRMLKPKGSWPWLPAACAGTSAREHLPCQADLRETPTDACCIVLLLGRCVETVFQGTVQLMLSMTRGISVRCMRLIR